MQSHRHARAAPFLGLRPVGPSCTCAVYFVPTVPKRVLTPHFANACSTVFHGVPRCSTVFHGVPRGSTVFHGVPRGSTGFHGVRLMSSSAVKFQRNNAP
ncbi:hypothetical protein EYF80_010181 [Liparis tanakae]|uniref:Uncharacterized protein n=1 Tax=Liparis tanakae TaxID=230148 RepID=A0A4Z2INJ5_9TELE|nr:hypothetical protein EYF80_010181 [Liparis tanakae]